jgi:hypothetical protein
MAICPVFYSLLRKLNAQRFYEGLFYFQYGKSNFLLEWPLSRLRFNGSRAAGMHVALPGRKNMNSLLYRFQFLFSGGHNLRQYFGNLSGAYKTHLLFFRLRWLGFLKWRQFNGFCMGRTIAILFDL